MTNPRITAYVFAVIDTRLSPAFIREVIISSDKSPTMTKLALCYGLLFESHGRSYEDAVNDAKRTMTISPIWRWCQKYVRKDALKSGDVLEGGYHVDPLRIVDDMDES